MDHSGASNEVQPRRLEVIDSHTAGEPTRTIVEGLPELGAGTVLERQHRLRSEHDWVRTSLIHEPRGSDVMVGAALVPPSAADCAAGVIFFNNIGYLGMCGHGTIGVITTLAWLGRLRPGIHRLETSVGIVTTTLHDDGRVSVENVPSYRFREGVTVDLEDGRRLSGDIAWGGNWFFLCGDHGESIALERASDLTRLAVAIRRALDAQGVTGRDGAAIDHIELTAPIAARDPGREEPPAVANFVLCPGLAYDRSPCGTGTSAKVACQAAEGRLAAGERLRVRGISGGTFEASYRIAPEIESIAPTRIDGTEADVRGGAASVPVPVESPLVVPTITGRAFVTARLEVNFDPADPFRHGLQSFNGPWV